MCCCGNVYHMHMYSSYKKQEVGINHSQIVLVPLWKLMPQVENF